MLDLRDLSTLTEQELQERAERDPEWFREMLSAVTEAIEDDRKACQLAFYTAANPMALPVHTSTAREVAIVGGNRSSKTDTMLAELAIQMTGHVPLSLQGAYPRQKLRPPIRARVVCNSITDTLEPIIKPKLRWDQWNGTMGTKGHWGWIPRHCLKNGNWEQSYSEKYRTLHASVDSQWVGSDGTLATWRGWSTAQFMSYDQDLSAFGGASMHFVGHDELPRQDIYRENRIRTMDVGGQVYTAFTPPDEAGVSVGDVAWFYDQVYEPGLVGPSKNPLIDTFHLYTEANTALDPNEITNTIRGLSDSEREVRLHGKFLHLSGIIYSLFATRETWWCFKCQRKVIAPLAGTCEKCESSDLNTYIHVVDPFPIPSSWPIVHVIDPHPRKPDANGWFAITPSDDVVLMAELEVDGTAPEVAKAVFNLEESLNIRPLRRIMDPNIATETNDKLHRGWTLRRAYDDAGLRCDLATDDINTGIQAVNALLMPDPRTRQPRFRVFSSCPRFIYGMGHWLWDDWTRHSADRELKERPRDRYKDFPDLIRYLALSNPTFSGLTLSRMGGRITHSGRSPLGY